MRLVDALQEPVKELGDEIDVRRVGGQEKRVELRVCTRLRSVHHRPPGRGHATRRTCDAGSGSCPSLFGCLGCELGTAERLEQLLCCHCTNGLRLMPDALRAEREGLSERRRGRDVPRKRRMHTLELRMLGKECELAESVGQRFRRRLLWRVGHKHLQDPHDVAGVGGEAREEHEDQLLEATGELILLQ